MSELRPTTGEQGSQMAFAGEATLQYSRATAIFGKLVDIPTTLQLQAITYHVMKVIVIQKAIVLKMMTQILMTQNS